MVSVALALFRSPAALRAGRLQDKPALTLLGIFSGLMYALASGSWLEFPTRLRRRSSFGGATVGGTLLSSAYLS